MNYSKIILKSQKQTKELGERIAHLLKGGEVILLYGDMGAGKTTLTQAIASGLSCNEAASSPTFTLQNIYHGRLTVRHFDLFRIESAAELEAAGLDEFFFDKASVCLIEWPEVAEPFVHGLCPLKIELKYIDENTREAIIPSDFGGEA